MIDRPPALRTDGSNAFARYSMQTRVPRIARDVLEAHRDYPAGIADAIERLARDIEQDAAIPAAVPPGLNVPAWTAAEARHPGATWLGAEWFFAEHAFYRELLRACRFWETGRDPFGVAKEEELAGTRPWARLDAVLGSQPRDRDARIAALLEPALWGNRVDLSYRVAAERADRGEHDLLADDRADAVPLLAARGAHVHFVADNTGTELALDLAFLDAVLDGGSSRVTVHLKMQPVFVSDAMVVDLWRLIDRMRGRGAAAGRLAGRLDEAFTSRRLELAPDPFWSEPTFLWDAPEHVRTSLRAGTIVVLKGDANYRRLVGDAAWPPTTPFGEAAGYLGAPVVCLRTMKSDPVLGLAPELAERLDATHRAWRVDGQHGVIQAYVT